MAEMVMSASEFRVRMKVVANSIAAEQHRVVVTRHGHPMVVVVSQEDYEFLLKHKPRPTPRPVPDPVEDVTEGIDHPDRMETADIERIYAATREHTDDYIVRWRGLAYIVLRARGRTPANRPDDFMIGGASSG
jgi:prevent-host-death family protein